MHELKDIFPVHYSWLIPLAPLMGAIISGFFGAKWLKQNSHWPIWIGVGLSALLSLCLITQMWPMALGHSAQNHMHIGSAFGSEVPSNPRALSYSQDWYTWIEAGTFKAT